VPDSLRENRLRVHTTRKTTSAELPVKEGMRPSWHGLSSADPGKPHRSPAVTPATAPGPAPQGVGAEVPGPGRDQPRHREEFTM
jgi:hypothetical protein